MGRLAKPKCPKNQSSKKTKERYHYKLNEKETDPHE